MRGYTRAAAAVVTAGLAVSLAACSSSGSTGKSSNSSTPAGSSAPANSGSSAAGGTGTANGPTPQPVGAFKTLTGQSTSVKLEPAFLQALTSLGVKPAPTGTAKLDASTGTISFPITGGNATIYPYKSNVKGGYVQGTIDHNGSGLSLSAGGTTVTLENFVINPGSNSELTGKVLVNGKVAYPSVKLFDLDGSTLQKPTISSAGVATLTGTTVYVSQAAAGALNTVFKLTGSKALPTTKDAIKVGIATIMATGK